MYTLNTNFPTSSSVSAKTVSLPGIDKAWFAPEKLNSGDYTYTNTQASSLGRPAATMQLSHSLRGNIYAGATTARVSQLPNKQGIKIYMMMRQSWTITDTEQPLAPEYQVAPSVSITMNVPNNELVTANVLDTLLLQAMAHLLNMNGKSILMDLASGNTEIR